ncbi:hypothetical protein HW555_007401, partial [Spodoptera exigua]
HEGGANTTESMTRALISDDPNRHIGHVQLGTLDFMYAVKMPNSGSGSTWRFPKETAFHDKVLCNLL